ncbi:MAG: sigma-54 dependent transcriptional regulator [Dysgonamonadaceae bacterium]
MKKGKICIVDDNKNVLSALGLLLKNYFEEVTLLSSPNTLLNTLSQKKPDVVLLDMNFSAGINSGNEGLFWLGEVKKVDANISVVLFTAYADIGLAVNALKKGANDFVVKPWDNAKLLATLESAMELSQSKGEIRKLREKQDILKAELNKDADVCWGTSEAMQKLLAVVRKVAVTDANVLITGENGTGKGLIAKMIHQLSGRHNETLVSVDMGTLSESLFESELFGYVKGAFTDARTDRAGKFEAADKGTLFLDEIGNLGANLQSKLLTALQSRQIVRIGSNKTVHVNIRLITATNCDLKQAVFNGEFREDLLYRINTIQIEVPPLRDRREDIAVLAAYFLHRFSHKYKRGQMVFHPEALAKLQTYSWPGNVRELEHCIEKAVILSDDAELRTYDFGLNNSLTKSEILESVTLEEMEKVLIEKALRKYDGNISAIAAELGISRPTLYSKMKKFNLS